MQLDEQSALLIILNLCFIALYGILQAGSIGSLTAKLQATICIVPLRISYIVLQDPWQVNITSFTKKNIKTIWAFWQTKGHIFFVEVLCVNYRSVRKYQLTQKVQQNYDPWFLRLKIQWVPYTGPQCPLVVICIYCRNITVGNVIYLTSCFKKSSKSTFRL